MNSIFSTALTILIALDPAGNRTQEVTVTSNPSGEAVLEIGPQYRTVWYELIVD